MKAMSRYLNSQAFSQLNACEFSKNEAAMHEKSRLSALSWEKNQSRSDSDKKICLFLGAGADIGAGGITFNRLKRMWYANEAKIDVHESTPQKEIESKFQEFFSKLSPKERARIVKKIFRTHSSADPSDAYKILALLIRVNFIDAVITTNFDVMLEKAAELVGKCNYDVFAPGLAKPYMLGNVVHLPGCPYVKVHGDLRSGHITVITQEEIDTSTYDKNIVQLINHIIANHNLIIAGYGGWDTALATIIANAAKKSDNSVYWCNPEPPSLESPLYKSLPKDRLIHIGTTFHETIETLARPCFQTPFQINSLTPQFIESLLDWRIEHARQDFIGEYATVNDKLIDSMFTERKEIESTLCRFIFSGVQKNLAVVVGNTGTGKTTLGIRLANRLDNAEVLLIKGKSLQNISSIEQMIMSYAGVANPETVNLFSFANWLAKNGKNLVFYLDAINEISTSQETCGCFVKDLLRTCYMLSQFQCIRFIITMRHELWSRLLDDMDLYLLEKILWNDLGDAGRITPLELPRFSDTELNRTLHRYYEEKLILFPPESLSRESLMLLRDPFLLGIVIRDGGKNPSNITSFGMLDAFMRRKIEAVDRGRANEIWTSLSRMAGICMQRGTDEFRVADFLACAPFESPESLLRNLAENGILVNKRHDMWGFTHDRIFQMFLALAFGNFPECPTFTSIEDIDCFVKNFSGVPTIMSAARIHFLARFKDKIKIIEKAQSRMDSDKIVPLHEDIFVFTKEIILDAADEYVDQSIRMPEHDRRIKIFRENKDCLFSYCSDVISAGKGAMQTKAAIQAAAKFELPLATNLLAKALSHSDLACAAEAQYYLLSRISEKLLTSQGGSNLLDDPVYADYVNAKEIPLWHRLFRLFRIVSVIGADNTHTDEYRAAYSAIKIAFISLGETLKIENDDISQIVSFAMKNLDRYMFNADVEHIESFFNSKNKNCFMPIVEKIEKGYSLTREDMSSVSEYMFSGRHPFEFFLLVMLFAVSSINNQESAIELWREKTREFTENSEPEEVDYYVSVPSVMFTFGSRIDLEEYGSFIRKIIMEMPALLLFQPGARRGKRRGFTDSFDMIFEDGFSLISGYIQMRENMLRQNTKYSDFLRAEMEEMATTEKIPCFYENALENFLCNSSEDRIETTDIHMALAVLRAISSATCVSPKAGLRELHCVLGNRHPQIRRALIRILSESYARDPTATRLFLDHAHCFFGDRELRKIKAAADPRHGLRQMSAREWGRIIHFILFELPEGRTMFFRSLKELYSSNTPVEAIRRISKILNLYSSSDENNTFHS